MYLDLIQKNGQLEQNIVNLFFFKSKKEQTKIALLELSSIQLLLQNISSRESSWAAGKEEQDFYELQTDGSVRCALCQMFHVITVST